MKLIVALDGLPIEEILWYIHEINADWYKVGGHHLFNPWFPEIAQALYGKNVFFDAKLADIPSTNYAAAKDIQKYWGPEIISVRSNFDEMLQDSDLKDKIAHVPYLTSDSFSDVSWTDAPYIVCRPDQAKLHKELIPGIKVICPGVRLPGQYGDDHVGSTDIPKDADFIVVGRPIIQTDDPRREYEIWLETIQ